MTVDEAIAISEAGDGEAIHYTEPLESVGKVLVAEIRRLHNMERLLQNHREISKQRGGSTVDRVLCVLNEQGAGIQHLLGSVVDRDKEIKELWQKCANLEKKLAGCRYDNFLLRPRDN